MNRTPCAVAASIALLCLAAIVSKPEEGLDPGRLWVSGAGSAVTEFDLELATGVTALVTGLNAPEGLAFGPDGRLFVAESGADRVVIFDATGLLVGTVGAGSALDRPMGLAFGPGETLYVTSFGTNTVRQYTSGHVLLRELGAGTGLAGPTDVALGPTGNVFVTSFLSDEVLEFDRSGALVSRVGGGSGLDGPWGLCFDRSGALYVASHENDRVLVFDPAGTLVRTVGVGSGLMAPTDIILEGNGHLLVASWFSNDVLEFDEAGNALPLFAPGELDRPRGLSLSPYFFVAKLKGRLQPHGGKEIQLKGSATVSVSPGSGVTSLRWLDPEGQLVTLFGSDALVFHGYEAWQDKTSRKRTFQGAQLSEENGGASLVLFLKGELSGTGRYEVTRAKGALQGALPEGALSLDVR